MTKLKNSKCDKTQLVTKLKLRQNWNCDKTQIEKLKLWQNSNCDKTQIGTKLKLWQNWNCDKTQIVREKIKNLNVTKPTLWQNSRTQIVTKLKKGLLVKTFWHLDSRWDDLWAAFCDSRDVLYESICNISGSWHFHQKLSRFSPNRPTGPIQSSSQSVLLVVEEVYHVPSLCRGGG